MLSNNLGTQTSWRMKFQKTAALVLIVAMVMALWKGDRLWDQLAGNPRGDELLFCASGSGALADIDRALSQGANINARSNSECTPIIIAAGAGEIDAVRALLARGADPSLTANAGVTAVHVAIVNDRPEVLGVLLGAGAKIDYVNEGETPLDVAERFNRKAAVSLLRARGAHRASENNLAAATSLPSL